MERQKMVEIEECSWKSIRESNFRHSSTERFFRYILRIHGHISAILPINSAQSIWKKMNDIYGSKKVRKRENIVELKTIQFYAG